MKDEIVEVIRSPEAPNLIGKKGVIAHKGSGWILVKIGNAFTHFRKRDIKRVKGG